MPEDKPKAVELTLEEASSVLNRLSDLGVLYCIDDAVSDNPIPALIVKVVRDGAGRWRVRDRFTLEKATEIIDERLLQGCSA